MKPPIFRSAAAIAAALGCSGKTVHRRAHAEGWQARTIGNRHEYVVPRGIRKAPQATPASAAPEEGRSAFLTLEERSRIWRVNHRFYAVDALHAEMLQGVGIERALVDVAKAFRTSPASLRRWDWALMTEGIAGLMEDKLGVVGRKAEGKG